jgi:hypothetical protein
MTLVVGAARKLGILCDVHSEHEERRFDALCGENIQNARRGCWNWTVVERENNLAITQRERLEVLLLPDQGKVGR